jgi:predicted nuclease of predicted toxin-antitoxin system
MNFIVDENLPWRAAAWVSARGHQAHHVSALGLLGKPDTAIWAMALRMPAHIITRDADFVAFASESGDIAVVRLLIGNCPTSELLARLEIVWPEIEAKLQAGLRLIEAG